MRKQLFFPWKGADPYSRWALQGPCMSRLTNWTPKRKRGSKMGDVAMATWATWIGGILQMEGFDLFFCGSGTIGGWKKGSLKVSQWSTHVLHILVHSKRELCFARKSRINHIIHFASFCQVSLTDATNGVDSSWQPEMPEVWLNMSDMSATPSNAYLAERQLPWSTTQRERENMNNYINM